MRSDDGLERTSAKRSSLRERVRVGCIRRPCDGLCRRTVPTLIRPLRGHPSADRMQSASTHREKDQVVHLL